MFKLFTGFSIFCALLATVFATSAGMDWMKLLKKENKTKERGP
jgi:hypothetical protein